MTKEELERLYMDIYDNGIPDSDYKEKFKRYVNNRAENLEKENKTLREVVKVAVEGIKLWGVVGGKERPFIKPAEMLFDLFLEKAESFSSEV